MGFGSIWHWIIVLVIVLLLFGAGKIPRLMGDMAKGVKAFKQGLKDENEGAQGGTDAPAADKPKPIDAQGSQGAQATPGATPASDTKDAARH
jgi:sec-independent protein translocase protein TatA